MVFSSILFLFYFLPAVLILYHGARRISLRLGNLVLLFFSLFFYGWGEPCYIWLLIGSCVFNWAIAMALDQWRDKGRLWLVMGCAGNLSALLLFKYCDFVLSALGRVLGIEGEMGLGLPLPIGISFFTFQALSYIIDVYRRDTPVQKNPFYVALYISLFPQLVAGPIVRYREVDRQITKRKESMELFSSGCCRFVRGLAKKLILADSFAVIADTVFSLTLAGHEKVSIPVTLAWLGAVSYALQIFFDFSGYSDMAIGLGGMLGFRFGENFRYPYISRSIREFWTRWHISLGTWFKEYIYIPLGGSHMDSQSKILRNMLVVWILTGLWHGAAWNFLFWGLFNFIFLALERLLALEKRKGNYVWRHLYALLVINFGWVLFRCESFYHLKEYVGNMLGMNQNVFFSASAWMFLREYAWIWGAGILLCMPFGEWAGERLQRAHPRLMEALYPVGMTALFFTAVMYLSKSGYHPFIYFNF